VSLSVLRTLERTGKSMTGCEFGRPGGVPTDVVIGRRIEGPIAYCQFSRHLFAKHPCYSHSGQTERLPIRIAGAEVAI
jgi:hypothetical protein